MKLRFGGSLCINPFKEKILVLLLISPLYRYLRLFPWTSYGIKIKEPVREKCMFNFNIHAFSYLISVFNMNCSQDNVTNTLLFEIV